MIGAEKFLTHSLRRATYGIEAARIMSTALSAVEPRNAMHQHLLVAGSHLHAGEQVYSLDQFRRIVMLAVGKAALPMAVALEELIGDRLNSGLVVTKHILPQYSVRFPVIVGGHPVPDENSRTAASRALELASGLSEDDLLICLISGGGSALLSAPVEGIALEDMQLLTRELLSSGADITEINILRRHLDQIKGGKLAQAASPSSILTVVLSDVIGNALESIASGPTAPDPTTIRDAFAVIRRYRLEDRLPRAVLDALTIGRENPGPGDHIFDRTQHVIIGSNRHAVEAAMQQALKENIDPVLLLPDFHGEASLLASKLCREFLATRGSAQESVRPVCFISGGESTVTIKGTGTGGRNQEMALSAAIELAGVPGVVFIALASDGEDGPTEAAGAIATGESIERGMAAGMKAEDYLERNDSYNYFLNLGDLIRVGPTGTNVNDLVFIFDG